MTVDPYAPPQAELSGGPGRTSLPVPLTVRALLLCGIGANLITVAHTARGTQVLLGQHVPWVYVAFDVCVMVVLLGLSYGLWRGSRTCAVLALSIYVLINSLAYVVNRALPGWMPLSVLILSLLGVAGAFRWQDLRAGRHRAVGA